PLQISIDERPARQVVLAARAARQVLPRTRAASRERLPGTRRGGEAILRLFPQQGGTALLGEQACESARQGLARSGQMKTYRFIHLSAHGESDPRHAYRAALLLAPDPDSGRAGDATPETDGAITAEQILRTWELDADLVVLSACESGLGRAA